MGFLRSLFSAITNEANNNSSNDFRPDLNKTEYENWLDFLGNGGTSLEWERLKSKNKWVFKDDQYDIYEKTVRPISDEYYRLINKIQRDWSVLHNTKDFDGALAKSIENDCFKSFALYQKMIDAELNCGIKPLERINIPSFRRLAMLYEKQGKLEECIEICKIACSFGHDERSRMVRMVSKCKRQLTEEELAIANAEPRYNPIAYTGDVLFDFSNTF